MIQLKTKIIFPFFTIASILLLIFLYGNFKNDKKVVCSQEVEKSIKAGRYSGFGPSYDTKLIACYGAITEEQWMEVENGYSLYDHINKYEITSLDYQGGYKVEENKIFVVVKDSRPKNLPSYGVWYFVDGEQKPFTYKSYDDIPKYIAIDIYSGEVTIYPNDLSKIPETESKIFKELEERAK